MSFRNTMASLMHHLKLHSFLFVSIFLLYCAPLTAQFHCLKTKNLQLVYYDQNHQYITPHLARCFENSLKFHEDLFRYKSREPITILLHDLNDYGHGGTSTMPQNFMSIGLEPFDYVYETQPANERMNWLMHHELAHVATIDKASKWDHFYRKLFFGKVMPEEDMPLTMVYSYLTNPRWYCPRWYHEGIAVFLETWMSGGLGRVLGGYDEMVFRTMIRDNSYMYDIVGLESEGTTIDFQIGAISYLYGTRFISYLALKFGPEKVLNWYNRDSGSNRYFSSQFENVFENSLSHEWSNWIEWEHNWQNKNLDTLNKYPISPSSPIIKQALGSVSRTYYDESERKIYAAINFPGQIAHIAGISLDTGTIEKLCEIHSPALYYVTFLAFDPKSKTFFYTTNNGRGWRDLNIYNLETNESSVLLKDTRTGDLAFNKNDNSVWGMQHHNGISKLVRFVHPYTNWQEVLELPYGKDLFDIDISPDGKYLSGAFIEVSGRQRLIKMDIERVLQGESSFDVLYEFENTSPSNFTFNKDGRYLYGSSYYTGVSNIWRYDFDSEKMDILTNAETGFFRPVAYKEDSLIVFKYTGDGFLPVIVPIEPKRDISAINYLGQAIVENHPELQTWNAGSPKKVKLDSISTFSGPYKPLANIKMNSIYPIIEGYKNHTAFGASVHFGDPLVFHDVKFTVSYTEAKSLEDKEKFHFSIDYNFWPWKLSMAYNPADFYDLFGPTKSSRKGYYLGLQYENYFINDKPETFKYTIQTYGFGDLEKMPEFQNVNASHKKLLFFKALLDYSYLVRSLGAVEYEQGFSSQFVTSMKYAKKLYPQFHLNFDYGKLLPLHHSSIWLRSAAGYAIGGKKEPFANFYFGAFGNNWIDYQDINRYRKYYSFPGAEINEIAGTNYLKFLLEWNLPPKRFRRFGVPPFYATWARATLFSSNLTTNLEHNKYKKNYSNFGLQYDLRLIALSHMKFTFSVGYAVALMRGESASNEFMVSLKIL